MKLLLHACCGPCAIMPTRLLRADGHNITLFYTNSNIAPASEYEKRLSELRTYALREEFPLAEGEYNPALWEQLVAPVGESLKNYSPAFGEQAAESHTAESVSELLDDERRSERCRLCYRMRLEEAAAYACENGFDGLATTLAVSPYQFGDICAEELTQACANTGLEPLWQDFTPYYGDATRISRELGMYRQNYCGCRFSVKEAEATRAWVKAQRKARKAAKRAAE